MELGSLKEGQYFRVSKRSAIWKVTAVFPYVAFLNSGSLHAVNLKTRTTRRYTPNHKSWKKQVILVE